MEVEYIYAVGHRVWADESGQWCFTQPQCDHRQALEVYDLTLEGDLRTELILLKDGLLPVSEVTPGLRRLLAGASEVDFIMLARAAEVAVWDRDHNFCSRCGGGLNHHQQDLAKQCDSCGLVQYPRLSPCIITLVTDGEYCLLAHGIRFPEPRYSTLAGFIEAGETAEAALAREVKEEVGVDVSNIRYFGSQSWPFPHSLMLGYFADYAGGEIVPEAGEIVDAKWFHYTELKEVPIPPKLSISRELIDAFIERCEAAA